MGKKRFLLSPISFGCKQKEKKGEHHVCVERYYNHEETASVWRERLEDRPLGRGRSVAMHDLRKVYAYGARRFEKKGKIHTREWGECMRKEETQFSVQEREKNRRSNYWFYSVLFVLLLSILAFRVYWTQSFLGIIVDGESMNETLYHGEKLMARYTTETYKAQRGDIIVVYVGDILEYQQLNQNKPEETQTKYLIKRLIAVEGDKVRCRDGQISICYAGTSKYVPLDEPYAYYSMDKQFYDFEEYVVHEGEIFFLGDNRYNSCDSRYKEEGGSNLRNRLYKEENICAVVPEWALEHQKFFQLFFVSNSVGKR